jgi:hypothetical protein
MQPIFITVGAKLPLMVIPDSQAHVDGHPVLTYTYSIYRAKNGQDTTSFEQKQSSLHLENKDDPDYMGYITFEEPGRLFTYTADGQQELSSDEVQETIELISEYRDSPRMWTI